MHVHPATPLNDDLHPRLHPGEGDRDAAGIVETLPRVLPVPGGDKEWYLYAARAGLPIGVASHRSFVSLARSPVAKTLTNRPAPPPFSSIMARRRRWLAAKMKPPERGLLSRSGRSESTCCRRSWTAALDAATRRGKRSWAEGPAPHHTDDRRRHHLRADDRLRCRRGMVHGTLCGSDALQRRVARLSDRRRHSWRPRAICGRDLLVMDERRPMANLDLPDRTRRRQALRNNRPPRRPADP